MSKFSSMGGGFVGYGAKFVKAQGIIATGGTTTEANGYKYHTFTSSGTLTVSLTLPGVIADYLVIAGGGGGGSGTYGGGGGAGGMLTGNISLSVTSYSITIGGGGGIGAKGANSVFSSYNSNGGGQGGTQGVGGSAGGSGGGGGYGASYNTSTTGGAGTAGPPRQGYDGGGGSNYNLSWAGAGGGAGGNANDGNGYQYWGGWIFGGNGYSNTAWAIAGDPASPGTFASGGSGFYDNGFGESLVWKIPGGGGNRASPTGLTNTGGGAGGNGTGGSGIVIIRYPS